MPLLNILILLLPIVLFAGGENTGKYEVILTTNKVNNQKISITIVTYDSLKSDFSSDHVFKGFLFNYTAIKVKIV